MNPRFLAALVACPILGTTAAASDVYQRPLDFSLQLGETKSALDYGNVAIDTTIQRIGVAWREDYGRIRLGLRGGYSFITQTGQPTTAGEQLDGHHAEISFDVDLVRRRPLTLYVGGAYLYERVKNDNNAQTVRLAWHEPSARLGALIGLTPALKLRGGLQYGYIGGQERLHGAINQTTAIGRRHDTGAFLALELTLDAEGGYIGIGGQSGIERGAAVYFGRRY